MAHSKRVAEIEDELAELRGLLTVTSARMRGLEVELGALSERTESSSLSAAPRTEAIAAVLREAAGTLSPTEILTRLHAAGRTDELRSVTATLDHLVKKDVVQRPSRGRYLVA